MACGVLCSRRCRARWSAVVALLPPGAVEAVAPPRGAGRPFLHVRIDTGLIVSRQAVCAAIAPRLDDLDALLEELLAGNGGPLADAERQAGWAPA